MQRDEFVELETLRNIDFLKFACISALIYFDHDNVCGILILQLGLNFYDCFFILKTLLVNRIYRIQMLFLA